MSENHSASDAMALDRLIAEMRSIERVARQCSVDGPKDAFAVMAAHEAERCGRWADELEAALAASRERSTKKEKEDDSSNSLDSGQQSLHGLRSTCRVEGCTTTMQPSSNHHGAKRCDCLDTHCTICFPASRERPTPEGLVWGTNTAYPETGPEWLTPDEVAVPPVPVEGLDLDAQGVEFWRAHYEAALLNWNEVIKERDELRARLAAVEGAKT